MLADASDIPEMLNEAAFALGKTPGEMGKFTHMDLPLQWVTKTLEMRPNNPDALNTKALTRYRLGQWRETLDACRQSIQFGNDTTDNWLLLAMTHAQLKQPEEARPWMEKALLWRAANPEEVAKSVVLRRYFQEAGLLLCSENQQPTAASKAASSNGATI